MSKDTLTKIFLDPSLGFISKDKLKKKLKKQGVEISNKELDEFYKHSETAQTNKKIVVKRYGKITSSPNSYQIDIMVMPKNLKKANRGYDKMLVLIDILSRKAFVYPLKDNKMTTILNAFQEFVEDNEVVKVQGDNEFNNKKFRDYCDMKEIVVITDVAKDDHITKYGNKLGIVDAFVKNLKNRIRMYMEAKDTTKYIDVLDKIVRNYNETPHSSLNDETPDNAIDDIELLTKIQLENAGVNKEVSEDINVKVGDKVRAATVKNVFDKQKATFSKKIYTVEDKVGNRFKLEGVKRLYKPYELLVVDEEKVIKVAKSDGNKIEKSKKDYKKEKALKDAGVEGKNVVKGKREKKGNVRLKDFEI